MRKNKQIRMRVSLEDMEKLEMLCGVYGKGKSELIRIFIEDHYYCYKRLMDIKKSVDTKKKIE